MCLPIFSIIQAQRLAFSLIFLSVLLPFAAHGACGVIPATYPLFSGEELKLDEDISINGNSVNKDDYKPNAAIDASGNVSTNVSLALPDLDPSSFPSNNSNTDLEIENTRTINHTSEFFYDKIEIKKKDITVNFTGGGPFHIDELKVKEKNVTLNFAAGIYYINKFKIDDKDFTLNVTSTPVIFHIGDEFKIDGKDANINTPGNVDGFLVYLHSNAKFESKEKNLDFTGLIYGPDVDKVEIEGKDSSIHGAIIVAGGEIELKEKNISFTYTAADQTAIGNTSTCSGGGGGGDTAATNFNCVENGVNGITGNLYTKTTAQTFSFDIVALQDASTIETSFASGADHTLTVELVNAENATSCGSYPVLSPAVSQSLNITASDTGTKTSATMSSGTAYSKVKCRVTDATDSPSIIGCSTDSFAIRPESLSISSSNMDYSDTPTPVKKAGAPFTLSVSTTIGYDGAPQIDNAKIKAHIITVSPETTGIAGIVSNTFDLLSPYTFNSAVNGVTPVNDTFIYSEVGLFQFLTEGIYDDSFTTVDQASDCTVGFSNTPDAAGKVGCKFGNTSTSAYFGRFTPDHFKITASTNGVFTDACTGFTYIGQAFSYQTAPTLTVTAYNGLSTSTVTANYTGSSYAKLIATDFNVTAPTTDSTQIGADGSTLINIESWTPGTPTLADNGDGSLTFTFGADDYKYQHENNSKIAPFTPSVDLKFTAITDSDNDIQAKLKKPDDEWYYLSSINPYSVQASASSIRFGRLNISNTHGTELNSLVIPVTTEYFNGNSFITNASDSCTALTLATHFSISDPKDTNCSFISQDPSVSIGSGSTSVSPASFTLNSGKYNLQLSAPGSGNTGFLDITSSLGNRSWLKYDWNADNSHDDCPSARATFGIYKGNSKQIYFREIY